MQPSPQWLAAAFLVGCAFMNVWCKLSNTSEFQLQTEIAGGTCSDFVKANMPRTGGKGKLHVHHWFTATTTSCKWNEDERWCVALSFLRSCLSKGGGNRGFTKWDRY